MGSLRTAVAAALLLAAGNSWALGLGQIQVKSKLNQPLLAEIPIISTTPGELAALKARLASPDTFRRVGLAPPSGAAADLQFSLGSNAKGQPIIRVTTLKPVEQSMVDFLIEVDWGNGRLVREYTALVGTPTTASAPVQASVQLAQASASNQVQRPVIAAPVAAPVPEAPPTPAVPTAPAAPPAPAAAPVIPDITIAPLPASEPAPRAAAVKPAPAAAPAKPAMPATKPAVAAAVPAKPAAVAETQDAQQRRVKPGESLSKIASSLEVRKAFSLDQTMLALLQANPDAFSEGNINRLRSGSVLRVPSHEDVAGISADEATQLVRQQAKQWVAQRRAVRQPEAEAATTAKPKAAENTKPAVAKAESAPRSATTSQGARLQIVPPSAPGKATGNKSGTGAGGEGSMLQQELRQRDEDIAAKTAEIGELKERVAALEKLKSEQQQLIALKDTELASAQQRLAAANQAATTAKAVTPAATTAQPPEQTSKSSPLPYVWGGIGVVVLALLAWLLAGRKPAKKPVRRSVFDSDALAASMKPAEAPPAQTPSFAQALDDAAVAEEPAVVEISAPAQPVVDNTIDLNTVPTTPSGVTMPTWTSGWMKQDVARTGGEQPELSALATPTDETPAAEEAEPLPDAESNAAPDAAPSAELQGDEAPAQAAPEQRFKLAKAFLDMGDEFSAQQILLELLDDEDEAVGAEAARMLSKLVG